ncbi:unnamed protein product [marine sediment metagenome]|uniref:Uncharacterized protein n=1 Tax=marine sediment metagenome TaxID=412755 RepID=X1RC75_9ZZZZ
MEIVKLSQPECRIATYIGRLRREISVAYGRKTRRDWTPDGFRNDVEAAAAEMAVAKYLNIYPEWQPTPGAVPRFDLTWNGQRLDVKSTQRQDGNLLIPYLLTHLLYVLVCGQMPEYRILGKINGFKASSVGRWVTLEHGPCWLVPADRLEPLKQY